ncbi:hypothetical protein HDU98_003815 [Podochytrium sp. JEL0797]|nr:hypothetical protein HDU98_003815 [Podochytrium sp. JEL0797]
MSDFDDLEGDWGAEALIDTFYHEPAETVVTVAGKRKAGAADNEAREGPEAKVARTQDGDEDEAGDSPTSPLVLSQAVVRVEAAESLSRWDARDDESNTTPNTTPPATTTPPTTTTTTTTATKTRPKIDLSGTSSANAHHSHDSDDDEDVDDEFLDMMTDNDDDDDDDDEGASIPTPIQYPEEHTNKFDIPSPVAIPSPLRSSDKQTPPHHPKPIQPSPLAATTEPPATPAAASAAAAAAAATARTQAQQSARRADPLQHQNLARSGITIQAAYSTGGTPAYSRRSNRPYIPEKMAADIPALATSTPQSLFQTTTPLPLPLHSLLESARTSSTTTSTTTSSSPPTPLRNATLEIAHHLATVQTTTGPLPNLLLETSLVCPPHPGWLPAEMDALDKGLELYGKNFTRIARDCVQSKTTFECIHAYYTRKHDLRSVKVKKYKKKVAKEDEEYVKYVGSLGKYIAMESKRMKADKVAAAAAANGGVAGSTSKDARFMMSSNRSASPAMFASSAEAGDLAGNRPVRVGSEIKGLMGSVKDLNESGVGSGYVFPSATNAGGNNGGINIANVISEDTGRGVRTRRSAAA